MPLPLAYAALGLGNLAGLLFGQGQNPADQYSGFYRRLQSLMGPQAIGKDTNTLFQQYLTSPSFGLAKRSLMGGANAVQNAYRMANAGAGVQTGVGTATSALGAGTYGTGLAGLYSGGYQNALQEALQLAQMRAGIAGGFQMQPNPSGGQLWGSLLGPLNQIALMQLLGGQKKS